MKNYFLILCIAALMFSCKALQESPKYKLTDGVYHTKSGNKRELVFVENTEDSILVYNLNVEGKEKIPKHFFLRKPASLPKDKSSTTIQESRYWKRSFDLDVLTIPFKYRPAIDSFPRQLSNHLNGALYLGYRSDTYNLAYDVNPIGKISQRIAHFGISAGVVTGFGVTPVTPWFTRNAVNIEYDGFIWSKGLAVMFGVDKLSFGLFVGVDHLLDSNKEVWIYQGKFYTGLTLGLNLN